MPTQTQTPKERLGPQAPPPLTAGEGIVYSMLCSMYVCRVFVFIRMEGAGAGPNEEAQAQEPGGEEQQQQRRRGPAECSEREVRMPRVATDRDAHGSCTLRALRLPGRNVPAPEVWRQTLRYDKSDWRMQLEVFIGWQVHRCAREFVYIMRDCIQNERDHTAPKLRCCEMLWGSREGASVNCADARCCGGFSRFR